MSSLNKVLAGADCRKKLNSLKSKKLDPLKRARVEELFKKSDQELEKLSDKDVEMIDQIEDGGQENGHSPSDGQGNGSEQRSPNNNQKVKDEPQDENTADGLPDPEDWGQGKGHSPSDGQGNGSEQRSPVNNQEAEDEPQDENVPSSDNSKDGNPPLSNNSQNNGQPLQSNDETPLFVFPGTTPDGKVRTVGWYGGRSIGYINMHGPRNAPRYRLERFAHPATYEEERDSKYRNEKVSNQLNRLGDQQNIDGRYKYTRRHLVAINGVAIKCAGAKISEDDIHAIKPEQGKKWAPYPTYVRVQWEIDGQIIKTWETRACIQRVWGYDFANKAIYEAAMEAEAKYEEGQGVKRSVSRSPSVGLVTDKVQQQRAASLGPALSAPAHSTIPHAEVPIQLVNPITADPNPLGQFPPLLQAFANMMGQQQQQQQRLAPLNQMPSIAQNQLANTVPAEVLPLIHQFANLLSPQLQLPAPANNPAQ